MSKHPERGPATKPNEDLLRRATEFRRDNVQMEGVGKARPAEELVMASFAADIVRECAEIAAPSRRDAILRKFGLEKE